MKVKDLIPLMKGAKAAIFDVDGTILDSMPLWRDCDGQFLRSRGKEPEPDLHRILFSKTMDECMNYLKTAYDIEESTGEIAKAINAIVAEAYRNEIPAKEGMVDLIRYLYDQGTRLVVATSNDREPIEAALKRLGILNCFEDLLFCSELGAGKGTPRVFEKALEILGTTAEDTYVLEDGLYAMKTAKTMGFPVIGVFDEDSFEDQPEIRAIADYYIEP